MTTYELYIRALAIPLHKSKLRVLNRHHLNMARNILLEWRKEYCKRLQFTPAEKILHTYVLYNPSLSNLLYSCTRRDLYMYHCFGIEASKRLNMMKIVNNLIQIVYLLLSFVWDKYVRAEQSEPVHPVVQEHLLGAIHVPLFVHCVEQIA